LGLGELKDLASLSGESQVVQIRGAYQALEGAQLVGLIVEAEAYGFQDNLIVLSALGTDGVLRGIRLLQNKDTPGLGGRASEEAFYGQFSGLNLGVPNAGNTAKSPALATSVALSRDGGQIDAITAATITSRALTNLVKASLEIAARWLAQNGGAQ
jgi:electron transport complex protein RnfG